MRQVDGWDDEGHEGVATVVLRVGEDGEVGFEEFHFWERVSLLNHPFADFRDTKGEGVQGRTYRYPQQHPRPSR